MKLAVEGEKPAGCMDVECMALTLYAAKHAKCKCCIYSHVVTVRT